MIYNSENTQTKQQPQEQDNVIVSCSFKNFKMCFPIRKHKVFELLTAVQNNQNWQGFCIDGTPIFIRGAAVIGVIVDEFTNTLEDTEDCENEDDYEDK